MTPNPERQGKIPEAFIDDLRERVKIDALLRDTYGVNLKRQGKALIANCPLPNHKDKTPSFSVRTDKNTCNCFGCNQGGDVFQVVMLMDGLSFPDAIEKVATYAGVEVPKQGGNAQLSQRFQAKRDMLTSASGIFQTNLVNHSNNAINTMIHNRGINSEMIQRFGLGVALDSWNQITEHFGGYKRAGLMSEAGLAKYTPKSENNKAKLYDFFRNGLVFPIRDTRGQVISFAQRLPEGQKPKYINGPETDLFKKHQVLYGLYESLQQKARPEQLVVVEGYTDVIAMHQHGFDYGSAPMGTALTSEQIDQLLRHTHNLTFCFDGDNAGRTAAKKTLLTALPFVTDQRHFKFSILPEGQDPDSLLKHQGADAFKQHLDNGLSLSRYMFKVLLDEKTTEDREALAKSAAEFSDMLNLIPDCLLKTDLANRFQDLTGFSLSSSLNIQVAAKNMAPSQLLGLGSEVRTLVAKHGDVPLDDVHVSIGAGHYKPISAMERFVNQSSLLKQGIKLESPLNEKVGLLNQAIEQVVVNTSLSVKDSSGLPLLQILSDAMRDLQGSSDTEHRLALMASNQLKNLLRSHDISNLITVMSQEIVRIKKLGSHIQKTHPGEASKIQQALSSLATTTDANLKYLEALGRFSPSQVYASGYYSSLNGLKSSLEHLKESYPAAGGAVKASMPTM